MIIDRLNKKKYRKIVCYGVKQNRNHNLFFFFRFNEIHVVYIPMPFCSTIFKRSIYKTFENNV